MKLLLDTATFIWLVEGDAKLSESARVDYRSREGDLSECRLGLGDCNKAQSQASRLARSAGRICHTATAAPQGGVAADRRGCNVANGEAARLPLRSVRPHHRQASYFLGFGDCDRRPADQDLSHAGRVVMREARDGRSASSSLSAPPLKHQQPAWMGATRRSASRRRRGR